MRTVLYYERQSLNRFGFACAVIAGVAGLMLVIPVPGADQAVAPGRGLAGFVLLLAGVVSLNALTMTTWVFEDELRVQFGRLVPYHSTRIASSDIDCAKAIADASAARAWGGPRSGTFNGHPARFLMGSARSRVTIETGQGRFIVGTKYPEKLAAAIEKIVGTASDAT